MNKILSFLVVLATLFFYGCFSCEEFVSLRDAITFSDLVIQNENLFVVGTEELIALDLTQAQLPVESSRVPLEVLPESVAASNACLFMNTNRGFIPYNILGSEVGRAIDNLSGCSAIPVAIEGNLLAGCTAIDGRLAIATYDIGLDKNLTLRQEIPFSNDVQGLALDSEWLFVINSFSGLQVYDITGANPELRHDLDRPMGSEIVVQQNQLMISGADSIFQYSYNILENRIDFLSAFTIN